MTHVMEEQVPIRCKGCHRRVGWAANEKALRNSVYCSDWCAGNPPATDQEVRNDAWDVMRAHGRTPVEISRRAGVAHSLVYKTLARYDAR